MSDQPDRPDDHRDEPLVRGLTLRLTGRFDSMAMMRALSLRPIRVEMAEANQVCDISSGQGLMFTPVQRVEHDHYIGSTTATPDEMYPIAQHFEALFHALDLLPPELLQSWNDLTSRSIQLDLLWTNEPTGGTDYAMPEPIATRLAAAKLALHISVFASVDAVERAVKQLHQARPPSTDA